MVVRVRRALGGSAGRGSDGPLFSRAMYGRLYKAFLDEFQGATEIHSGAAAWVDYLPIMAVRNGDLKPEVLKLHFPAEFFSAGDRIAGFRESANPAGRVANYWHWKFSQAMGKDAGYSLRGIREVLMMGVAFEDSYSSQKDAFKARNTGVALGGADHFLAATWYHGSSPKPGSGTLHAWNQSQAPTKVHWDLWRFNAAS